jgi:hypothetical protein
MTLTQFEQNLATLPSGRATQAASASHALRTDLNNGEAPFATARDRVFGQAWIRECLADADLVTEFSQLSGP